MSERIPNTLIDVNLDEFTGYPEEMQALDTDEAVFGAMGEAARDFPEHLYVPRNEWKDKAAENDELGLWAINYTDRFTNQGKGNGGYSTHECTTHCLRACAESAWNRQRRIKLGPPVPRERLPVSAESASVWFSCLSIYAEANPRQWGGANVQQVLSIAINRGFIPDKIQPKDWGFKHDLQGTCGAGGVNQSRGSWVSVRDFPDGWEETARHFRPLECVNPRNEDQYASLLLHGYAIGIGRNGHSVPIMRMVLDNNRWYYEYPDSYDVVRYDSRAYTSGSYSIISFTAPDDWNKPAG